MRLHAVRWLAMGWMSLGAWAAQAADRPGASPAEPPEGNYVQFPEKRSGLVFSAFRSAFLDPADEEDEVPLVFQLTRRGVPLWSRVATIEYNWPFLSTELKVVWPAGGGKTCLASYRYGRGGVMVFAIDLSEKAAKHIPFQLDDAVDAALASKGDDGPDRLSRESVEAMEWLKDGSAKITIQAARSRLHRIVLNVDGQTGIVTRWTVE
jgi:hypothetical protein